MLSYSTNSKTNNCNIKSLDSDNKKSIISKIDLNELSCSEEGQISLKKVFENFERYLQNDLFQQSYMEDIIKGKIEFYATGDGNWDFYIEPKSKHIYSIAKRHGCCSTDFGSIDYYKRVVLKKQLKRL